MKKLCLILIVLTMLLSVVAIFPTAYEGTNVQRDIDFVDESPVIDGEVKDGEYGNPVDAWTLGDPFDENEPVFYTGDPSHEIEDDLSIEFYATYDSENLYLAWKVYTKYDSRLPWDMEDGWMFEYCCVQFVITPGAPNNTEVRYQTAEWSGDYLEVGLCLRDDESCYKRCWASPGTAGDLSDNQWEFVGSRDDGNWLTTYECRLPWSATGVEYEGCCTQFGLNFGVCAHENYADGMGIVEYVDGIAFGKNADNAVCFTLIGDAPPPKPKYPTGACGVPGTRILIYALNSGDSLNDCVLVTDPDNIYWYNPRWDTVLLLRPLSDVSDIDGHYRVVEMKEKVDKKFSFQTAVEPRDVALIFRNLDSHYYNVYIRKHLEAMEIGVSQLYIFGFQTKDGEPAIRYNNTMVIFLDEDQYIDMPQPDEDPGDESSQETEESAPETDASEENESREESAPEVSAPEESISQESAPLQSTSPESIGASSPEVASSEDQSDGEDSFPEAFVVLGILALCVMSGGVTYAVVRKKGKK